MDEDGGPEVEWYMLGGDGECDHETTSMLGGDAGKNQYYYCGDCEGVLLRIEDGEDEAILDQQAREAERRRRSANPMGSVVDALGSGNGSDSNRSWLASKLYRLFK